ncbi:MAG: NADH-quinone oxidoreductase subunit C [Deltaproteobacteria bacterium]|nr:NADH-quinone oxidoreductase subunit C [Deltaproteobacteria bacterium]
MNLELLKEKFPNGILELGVDKGQNYVKVNLAQLHDVVKFCKEENSFNLNVLMDIVAVDYHTQEARFELIYIIYSIPLRHRLRLKVRVKDGESVPTCSDIYKSADWAEREIFDMFGIQFNKHPNLKRILMFEGFEGHPLRKDYPTKRRQKIPVMKEVP